MHLSVKIQFDWRLHARARNLIQNLRLYFSAQLQNSQYNKLYVFVYMKLSRTIDIFRISATAPAAPATVAIF